MNVRQGISTLSKKSEYSKDMIDQIFAQSRRYDLKEEVFNSYPNNHIKE